MLTILFLNLLEVSAAMSVLAGALLLFGLPIRRVCRSEWRYAAFFMIALRLLLPFNTCYLDVPVAFSIARLFGGNEEAARLVVFFCALAWILGAGFLTLRYIVCYRRFRREIRRWGRRGSRRVSDCLRKARFATDVLDSRPGIRVCPKVNSPVTVGIFRPLILIPSEDYSDGELEAIFRHELVHCRRHDVLYKFILLAACVLNWFNPVIWAMAGAATSDMELSCDAEVIRRSKGTYRRTYSEAILRTVSRELCARRVEAERPEPEALTAAFHGKKRILKNRIANIFDARKKVEGLLGLIGVGTLALLLSIVVSVAV